MRTRRGYGAALVLASALVVAAPGVALSAPAYSDGASRSAASDGGLPRGWSLDRSGALPVLRYRSGSPLPVTDAAVEVRTDSARLGRARVSQSGDVEVTLRAVPADLATVRVTLSGRPLEARSVPAPGRPGPARPPAPSTQRLSGPYKVVTAHYRLAPVAAPGYPVPLDVQGRVVAPVWARGRRPVVMFMHGRHVSCYRGGVVDPGWPCRAGFRPLPSMDGYDYIQRELASHGYYTVSVDLNAVNGQDATVYDGGAAARSLVARSNLKAMAQWAAGARAPYARSVSARFDIRKVMLVGHSRGGEGANQATLDSARDSAYRIVGQLLIAPTEFGRTSAATTPTLTLLPSCDGDVMDLQGQQYSDQAQWYGARHAVSTSYYIPGANHNFFNTEWTPGLSRAFSEDDGISSPCPTSARLTPSAQQKVGIAYTLAAANALLSGSTSDAAVVDGSRAADGTQGVTPVLALPTGGARRTVWQAGVTRAAFAGATVCPPTSCVDSGGIESPHWLLHDSREPSGLAWAAGPGAVASVTPERPLDLSGSAWLESRVVVTSAHGFGLRVRITDTAGHSATVVPVIGAGLSRLPMRPGTDYPDGRFLARLVRAPLPTSGVDLTAVRSIEWVAVTGTARVVILDASAASPGVVASGVAPPLRVWIPRVAPGVPEGSRPHVARVPLQTTGRAAPGSSLLVSVSPDLGPTRAVPIATGSTRVSVPVNIDGNTRDDPDADTLTGVESRGPVLVSSGYLVVSVRDDDPAPRLTLTRTASAKRGGTLRWTATLDAVSGRDYTVVLRATSVTGQIDVNDLTAAARRTWGNLRRSSKPLSQARAVTYLFIPAGSRRVSVDMRLVNATHVRPGERVRLAVSARGGITVPKGTVLTGTVRR